MKNPRKKRHAKRLSQSAVFANWHAKPLSAKVELLVDASANRLIIQNQKTRSKERVFLIGD